MAQMESDLHANMPVIPTFEAMELKPDLLAGIYRYGFKRPTAIQKRFMYPFIQGRDVIAQASSGSGKTSAICIAALQCIGRYQGTDSAATAATEKVSKSTTEVLILSPTRELALQTQNLCQQLSGDTQGAVCHACIGGQDLLKDLERLQNQTIPIISGTPGRVLDLVMRRALSFSSLRVCILDEADELLNRGFQAAIHSLYRYMNDNIQFVLLSATLPADVLDLARCFMTEPIARVLVPRDEIAVDGITQFFVRVGNHGSEKVEILQDLLRRLHIAHAVLFCNTRQRVELLTRKLMKSAPSSTLKSENSSKGADSSGKLSSNVGSIRALHGEMEQQERERALEAFRDGFCRILVTTDLCARGMDVPEVTLVLNYDWPLSREQYIHRIGRTGRMGRTGLAISFVKTEELPLLKDVEQFYATQIEELPASFGELE